MADNQKDQNDTEDVTKDMFEHMADLNDASTETDLAELVIDSHNDIAKSQSLERMRVAFPNRRKFQRIYVRKGTVGDLTTTKYNPETEAPGNSITSIAPTTEEEQGESETVLMLVVGIVDAIEPGKYVEEGGKKSKEKEAAKANRSVIERPDKVLRVLMKMTDYIKTRKGYYVAINQLGGLCDLRVIAQKNVFFFEEFWPQNFDNLNRKDRAPRLSQQCQLAASWLKIGEPKAHAVIADSNDKTWMSSNALRDTPQQNMVNMLHLECSMYLDTQNTGHLTAMHRIVESHRLALKKQVTSGRDGITAFLAQENDGLSLEDSQKMIAELTSCYENFPSIDAQLLVKIRKALMQHEDGAMLSERSLPMFLEMMNQEVRPEQDDITVHYKVGKMLKRIPVAEKYRF